MIGPPQPRTILDRAGWRSLLRRRPRRSVDTWPRFVICGIEHSGTSLLADIFRQVPGLGAGWETGVLLANRPADFPEVQPHFDDFAANWGVSDADIAYLCAAVDHGNFYQRLIRCASNLPQGTRMVFDKTPRYFIDLTACMGRALAPFIVTYKDPRAIMHSNWVRAGRPEVMRWLDGAQEEVLGYLLSLHEQHERHWMNQRVFFMSLESLCLAPGHVCNQVFHHAALEFDPGYLILRGTDNRATYGNTVMAGVPFAWRREWPAEAGRAVEAKFSALDRWFYS